MQFPLIIIFLILIVGAYFLISSILTPPKAEYDDVVFEDINGDNFLNVTLKHCLKTGEKSIPDGSFNTSDGEITYHNAKQINYVDLFGHEDYFIIWDESPDQYSMWNLSSGGNVYISAYLTDDNGKLFFEYSYEHDQCYGVMMSTKNDDISESELMYQILGLNKTGFDLVYSGSSSSSTYGGSYSSTGNHYHTVVPDRYTLSRTDPGSYYDHYEYGDNYEIDDYLESEGYD